jgi:hypothetical protein
MAMQWAGFVSVDTLGRARPGHVKPCGTRAAYRRHLNHGEVTCAACCAAEAGYKRALRHRRQDARRALTR